MGCIGMLDHVKNYPENFKTNKVRALHCHYYY